MIPGFNFIKELGTMGNQLISKLFSWAQPVMPEIFSSAPTTATLPDRHCALYKTANVTRLYYNINGVIGILGFSDLGILGKGFNSYANITTGVLNATATTLYTLTGVNTTDVYLLIAHVNVYTNNASTYTAVGILTTDGATAVYTSIRAGNYMTIAMSGMAIQGTQSSGATQSIYLYLVKISSSGNP